MHLRNGICICLLLTVSSFAIASDDCYQAVKDGKEAYRQRDYKLAKELFLYAIDECGRDFEDAEVWLRKSNQALKEASKPKKTVAVVPEPVIEADTVAAPEDTPPDPATLPPFLTLSQTSITAPTSGTVAYISVNTNREWEIEYPTGNMYTASRIDDSSVRVEVFQSIAGRSDFFYVKTTDGSQTVKVTLNQGKTSSGGYHYSNSGRRRSSIGYTELEDYNIYHGTWEVEWYSARFGIMTGIEFDMSLLAFRWSFLKVEPIVMGLRYDFVTGYGGFYYQPVVKAILPWDDDWAAEFGVGPSINVPISGSKPFAAAWFTIEAGVVYHWGDLCSSDFFFRYDGIAAIGMSINFSTGY